MSLLSYDQLAALVKNGVIQGPDIDGLLSRINSASIDITLGGTVLVESDTGEHMPVVDFSARSRPSMVAVEMDPEKGYVLRPGEFILASSVEVFNLPNYISCEYKLKSSMARIGLDHLNAGWCDAGWHGSVLTLELKNLTQYHAIRLRPGDSIGQMVFFAHQSVPSERSYAARGRYNMDKQVSSIKK